MKSQYEIRFEKLIVTMILSDINPAHSQLELFMDFHRNSNVYYDIFCDALFVLANRLTDDFLWITPSGKPYLAPASISKDDFLIATLQQVPEFVDDLKTQLDSVFTFMQQRLAQNELFSIV